jgi:heptosyltransferase-2
MPEKKRGMKTICIFNPAFLGDAVLTLPLIQTVARQYPGAKLHYVVRRHVGPAFMGQPEIMRVWEFDKRGEHKGLFGAVSFGRRLAQHKPDLVISAHLSLRSGIAVRAMGAKRRIGYAESAMSRLFYTDRVSRRFDEMDEIERLLLLADPLGIEKKITTPSYEPPKVARETALEFFEHKVTRPVLGVHPGSTWPTKKWPAENFGEIIGRAARAGYSVLVFSGQKETFDAAAAITAAGDLPPGRVHNLGGRLTLEELAAYLGMLDCYLTNDSGPMHLAWIQGTPVDAVFGPTVEKLGFFPRGEASTVHQAELPCRPCSLHGPEKCPEGHHDCMNKITPDQVWASVKSKLEASG